MPLQKFAPVSPDPSIQTDGDMTLAKFGHLNSVIDYINTYVAADSLQLEGTGSLSATPRYITDAGGNLSSLAISTGNIGIGTNTPSANLHINGHVGFGYSLRISTDVPNGVAYAGLISNYVTGVEQYQHGGPGWGWPNWTTTRTGGTAAAPTAVPNSYGLNEYSFWGHDGTSAGQAYSMMTRAAETWTPTGHGIYTTFNTTKIGATAVSERMRFTGLGNVTFNNASDSAIVSIKGTGSTSATTSLLVQNSSSNESFKVRDDGVAFFKIGSQYTQIQGDQIYINGGNTTIAPSYIKSYISDYSIGTIPAYRFNLITGDTPRLSIDGAGNVGIGTTTPTEKLHVVGRTYSSSGVVINAGSRFSTGGSDYGSDSLSSVGGGPMTLKAYYYTIINRVNAGLVPQVLQVEGQTKIIGSGSTSATTSFLVQNSSGTETLRVYDSGSVNVGLGLTIGSGQSVSDGTFALNNQNLQSYNSFSIETVPQNRQIKLRPASVEVLAANYYLAANQIGVVVYDTGSYSHHASAVLQANSTTRGFLPPRMTTAEKLAIASPAAGLMVYDTDLNKSFTYDGTTWQAHW